MLNYDIQKRKNQTKTIWLYEQIKNDILTGVLSPGERLPSKRDLAQHLSLSIITIENALGLLEEEGFVRSVPRSGFYVNATLMPDRAADNNFQIRLLEDEPGPNPGSGSARDAVSIETSGTGSAHVSGSDTASGFEAAPAADSGAASGPVPGIGRLMRRILSEEPDIMLRMPPHLGCAVLRNAIAQYLLRFRGMQVQPANILIGSGAEYLYGILVQLLGRDQLYGIEDPSYTKIKRVYEANGAFTEPLRMGEDGIDEKALKKARARVLHVSPFHSWPSGVTASAEKRFSYLAWAYTHNAYIIEDDFDSELTFFRKPLETLYALDNTGRVIYMNTFSKSIGPGMRIAYMVLPDPLLKLYEEKLGFYSCTVPVFDQYVLAAFIQEGGFERHLGRVRRRMNAQ